MAGGDRHDVDELLIQALACGATVETAARSAGVSPRTAYRRKADPEFRRQLDARQAEILDRTARALTASQLQAVKTLNELLHPSMPSGTRLGAVKATVELGLKVQSAVKFEARLAAMKSLLAGRDED